MTPAEFACVERALDTVFPDVHRKVRDFATQSKEMDGKRIRLYGSALADFIDRWSLRARGVKWKFPPSSSRLRYRSWPPTFAASSRPRALSLHGHVRPSWKWT